MQFLKIQNKFEAPIDGFTTLGFTTSTDDTIGQFGSGSNHGILCCLRAGIDVIVYSGKTRLTFSTKDVTIKEDGIGNRITKRVTVRKGNGLARALDWDLNFGRKDWTNVGMALREFVSNAIDRHTKHEGWEKGWESGELDISLVNERDLRAKAGYTRVYVEVNDEVREYQALLGKNFLHFSDNPADSKPGLIPSSGAVRIYRCGVFVMEVDEEVEGSGLFNYNFSDSEISIDESRNSSIYTVRAACADALRNASVPHIAMYLKSLGEDTFESSLDPNSLLGMWSSPTREQEANWAAASKIAFDGAYLVSNPHARSALQKKGKDGVLVNNVNLVETLRRLGISEAEGLLTQEEEEGIVVLPPTDEINEAFDWAWGLLRSLGMTEKKQPGILSFEEKDDEEGYVRVGVIYIKHDLEGDRVKREMLHQLVTYLTDYNERRDFLLNLIIEMEASYV